MILQLAQIVLKLIGKLFSSKGVFLQIRFFASSCMQLMAQCCKLRKGRKTQQLSSIGTNRTNWINFHTLNCSQFPHFLVDLDTIHENLWIFYSCTSTYSRFRQENEQNNSGSRSFVSKQNKNYLVVPCAIFSFDEFFFCEVWKAVVSVFGSVN